MISAGHRHRRTTKENVDVVNVASRMAEVIIEKNGLATGGGGGEEGDVVDHGQHPSAARRRRRRCRGGSSSPLSRFSVGGKVGGEIEEDQDQGRRKTARETKTAASVIIFVHYSRTRRRRRRRRGLTGYRALSPRSPCSGCRRWSTRASNPCCLQRRQRAV